MAVVKCEKGHYYDNKKYDQCPHCEKGMEQIKKEAFIDDIGILMTQGAENTGLKEGATVGVYSVHNGTRLVTGWLVVVRGPYRGRDYRLYGGWNKIGRGIDMDIYMPDDLKISKSEHAAVVCDSKKGEFYLVSRQGSLTYLNGQTVNDSVRINTGDNIEVGDSRFIFIAFCTEERRWENI